MIPFATLLLGATVLAAPTTLDLGVSAVPTDTLVDLRRGDRLVIESLDGGVSIVGWDRDQLQVRGDASVAGLLVRRAGSTVTVMADDQKRRRRRVQVALRVPAWIDVQVDGRALEVRVDGVGGRVDVRNVSGDVWIENTTGVVAVQTMEGDIDVTGALGGVSAGSQSGEVTLRDVSGPVSVQSGSGDVGLMNIRSESVQAETLDGDIDFSGTIGNGDYGFFVHDGDATIAIPTEANARVSVSTFDGEFQSDFPVVIEHFTGGREFDFTIGRGGARIQIQVFDGEIRLLRR